MKIKIKEIASNPDNPRGSIYEWHVQELWESFGSDPISGITVRLDNEKQTGKKYVVVTGDHRFEAAKRRGDEEVDVVILDITREEALIRSLQENEVRLDNEPVSFGMALSKIKEANPKLTHDKLASMFGLKSHSAISDKLAVKDLSEEVRNKIQEYNNNVMVTRATKKDGRPGDIHALTLPLISTRHIREVVRAPVSYHSQVVDKIITNESGELLTVKETKELVEDIREKTKKLNEIQNYVIEGMNRVPPKYRAKLMDKFEKEKINPLGIKQMIEEFNGDIILEAVHIEDTFDEILETPYTKIERYDKSTQFDSNVLDLIKEKCEIPELPKNAWAIEIRDLLQARKVDIAISKLFTSLTDKELNDEDKKFVIQKTHQTIKDFGLETQVRNHIRQFVHYTETSFSAVKDLLENPMHVIDVDEQQSVYVEIQYDKDLDRCDFLGKWIINKEIIDEENL